MARTRTKPTPPPADSTDTAALAAAATELTMVPLDRIGPHPRNVRHDVGDVTELANSIREVGLLEPLVAAPGTDPTSPLVLIAGHRRIAAAALAGLAAVPVLIRHDLVDAEDQIVAMLVENLQRTDLTAVEEAEAYQQLELAGMKTTEIARRTGRSKSTVTGRLKLMTLPEDTRARVHGRQLSLEDALAITEFSDDPADVRDLERAACTYNFKFEVQRIRRRREHAAAAAVARAQLDTDGVRVVTRSDLGGGWIGHYYLSSLHGRPMIAYDSDADHATSADEVLRAWHETCPGHAALTPESATITWVCTTPKVHQDADDTDDVDQVAAAARGITVEQLAAERDADAEADRAASAKLEEDLAAAAAVRAEFLRSITTSTRPDPGDLTRARAIARLMARVLTVELVEFDNDDLLMWLGVTDDQYDDEDTAIEQAVAERDPHRVQLAVLACVRETSMAIRPHFWQSTSNITQMREWLRMLEQIGHVLSSVERELIDQAAQDAA